MIDDILAQLFDEELQSRAQLLSGNERQYRSRAALERLLDAAQADGDSQTTPWMVTANDIISDYGLGQDASAYILQIAAARDAAAAQAAAAQAAARADLLAEMERRVIGCADDWEDYRYASWASAADDTLAQATAATADADWLRAKAQEWDTCEQLMGSRRGYRTETLLQGMDEYYYGDRSGQATWAWAAQAVLAESGDIESWATQWLLGVAQDRDRAAQAANSPFLHVPQWLLDYAQDGDTQDAQDAQDADAQDADAQDAQDRDGDAQDAQAAARASLLSAAMLLAAAGGCWNAWSDVGAAVLDAQDVPADDASWLRAEMEMWDARADMMAIARSRAIGGGYR